MASLTSAKTYQSLIASYFEYIKGEFHTEYDEAKTGKDTKPVEIIIWDRQPEPALLSSLALYLGFNSRQEFETYERTGKYRALVKRARLRIEAEYERKLHQQAPTGAIFALKSLGWNEKPEAAQAVTDVKSLQIEIIVSGPAIATNEKQVEI